MRIYSIFEYMNTHIMSIKQRNKAKYPEYEYSHAHDTSMADKLIRAQAEQLRENPAEYVARKYGIRGDVDGQKSNLRLRGCESSGKRD